MDVGRLQLGAQRVDALRARGLQLALDVGPGVLEDLAAARVFVERDVELLEQVRLDPRRDAIAEQRAVRNDDRDTPGLAREFADIKTLY